MANTTLEEHQARVEQAGKTLSGDLQQLALWGRRVKQRMGTGKVLVLIGSAAVLGILAVRATYRRQQRVIVRTAVRPEAPSLVGTAIRMALLEATRLTATRLVHRFLGGFERPRIAGSLPAETGGIRRGSP